MAVGTVFLLLVPYILQRALDTLAANDADLVESLIPAGLAIVVVHALHGFFTYLRGRWAAQASEGIVRRLRHRLYEQLEQLPCDYHDHADTGDLVQRCSSDVETVRVFLASQVVEIARVSLFVAVALPIMLTQDLKMTLISTCILPVLVVSAVIFFRKVRREFKEIDEAEGRLTTVIQENLTGIRVVRAFGRQDYENAKFLERNSRFRDLEYKLFHIFARFWSLSDLLVFLQTGLALIGGAYFVLRSELTLGQWVLYFWLVRTIIWPVRHIGRVLADSSKATVAIGRIEEVLNETVESEQDVPASTVRGPIVVKDLSFAYRDGQKALHDLSITIHEGETIALLGPPGAGKSTFVNLLVRLYDYETGTIHIGEHELRNLNRDALRDAFGMVLQDPFLFSRSVRENVIIGKSSAAEHEIEESARAADIHQNIVEFERGYETPIGERGVTLSGGQRQRLAIARALLKQPTFLVLDDSLSAVDTKTEAQILRVLATRRNKQTTILIAHRLSSTRLADRIFLLDHGRLVQQGTHEELLAADGPYRKLWSIQGTLEEEIERDLSGAAQP
ncbi:MAG: ABC transporter ATP-binding protein [Planctomycetaceae bacterium]|nr:ABC transporter ATP-binding protein [Planctomycetales bacterium]MCB9924438.1 ABC transporter ATP-binding protein [Planctomycetaceae bacterium]